MKTNAKPKADGELPSKVSLVEMPELDFTKYRVRRNPYAARIAREGVELVHDEPSKASLREIPEIDFATAVRRPNPYATRAAETPLQYGRGRPKATDATGPTTVKSLRLPQPMWKALDAAANARNTTVHALLRELVETFLDRQPAR